MGDLVRWEISCFRARTLGWWERCGVRVDDGSRMRELENRDAKIWGCGSAFLGKLHGFGVHMTFMAGTVEIRRQVYRSLTKTSN